MSRFASALAGTTFLALLAAPVGALPADTLSPGIVSHADRSVGAFDAVATLPNSERVVFDGTSIRREAEDGTFLQLLGTLPIPVYASFVLPDPTATFALVGESSRGRIYRVDLAGAGMQFLTDIDFNFDARFEDAGHVLVTAAPCGFSCGSEIYRVALANGATSLLASVSGPSGPLAIAPNGDLYYGVIPDFPAVTGSIVRWSAAQVGSGALLTEGNAALLASGIDPASSLEIEPVYGHLFAAHPVFGGTSRILEYRPNGQLLAEVLSSAEYLSGIQFLRTSGIGSFQAFQPQGVRLAYRATDYGASTSAVRTVKPRRPRAFTSGPGLGGPGLVTFTVQDAQPNSSFVVLMCASALYNPNESTYDYGTFLLHTGMPLGSIRRLGGVQTDSQGNGSFQWTNPGGLEGQRVFQALIRGANGGYVGSSTEAFN